MADGSNEVVASPHATPIQQSIMEIFQAWDVNGDGVINKEELHSVLVSLGMTNEEATSTFLAADANKDDQIDYKEFVSWLYSGDAPKKVRDRVGNLSLISEAGLW